MQRKRFDWSGSALSGLLTGALLLVSCASVPSTDARQRPMQDWHQELTDAHSAGDQASFARALAGFARQWPATLNVADPQEIYRAFDRNWRFPAKPEELRSLYDALLAANWKPFGVEPVYRDYIPLLMETGDLQKAREVARRMSSPVLALQLKVDNRYESLVRAEPDSFDIAALAARQVADWEAASRRYPGLLRVKVQLLYAYRQAGQPRKAVALADGVLAAFTAGASAAAQYDDPASLNWIYDTRGHAYAQLGDWGAAERDLQAGAAMHEKAHSNVSNALNLANFLADQGRAQDALAVLTTLGDSVSGYGRMVEQRARHVAAMVAGDTNAARKALAYMREHREDSPRMLLEALVRMQLFDEAASELMAWLADPQTRGEALLEVQQYVEVPQPAAEREMRQRYEQLLQRDDVSAAIARVGRVEQVPIPNPLS
jgi:hypothetical protein